ncbi:polysaccharide deacetylase [Candidatus Omnitrophus magneticus]|uniref:Polysaccharide deacetylase n=1 Tax=Candidatus Omnitrophus magneticus TaxID=1609969 RepID=A0A0F0CRK0_9BACT|nr:polysaccharide deacetylase [Candidatus Omnitrophus magneticus]
MFNFMNEEKILEPVEKIRPKYRFKNKFVIFFAVLLVLYFGFVNPRRVTPVLVYHSISDIDNTLNVSPENFERQMKFLKENGYHVISLDEFIRYMREGKRYIPKTVVITFDDGYVNNYINGYNVLLKYNMPATIFLATGHIGKDKDYLTWDEIILMNKNKVSPGAHTRNHVYLPSLSDRQSLIDEIKGSRDDIKNNTGIDALYFCYPTGGFTEEIKNIVKSAGYLGACTTNRGLDRFNKDIYEIKRVKVTNSDTTKPFHFRAKLSGFYNVFRSPRSGY